LGTLGTVSLPVRSRSWPVYGPNLTSLAGAFHGRSTRRPAGRGPCAAPLAAEADNQVLKAEDLTSTTGEDAVGMW